MTTLITGGAGFIGTNLALRLLDGGGRVTVLDNLSRPGVDRSLSRLRDLHPRRLRIELGDIRDPVAVTRAVTDADRVVHLAAQTAVTRSLVDPRHDFDVNALGTMNLLLALKAMRRPPPLLFTSTNKVYGNLGDIALTTGDARYEPVDSRLALTGIGESRRLDFHSPYGCSKGAADQYVLDFARSFGAQTIVFRMSCIYGPHQIGTQDQGWVAHLLMRALRGQAITLFGDGKQVRDILYVDDLVDAILLAFDNIDVLSGRAFNIGGGSSNTVSLLELIRVIADMNSNEPDVRFDEWRPGDQRYYVSDTSRFSALTGWCPTTGVAAGVRRLRDWLVSERVPAPRALQNESACAAAVAAAGDR